MNPFAILGSILLAFVLGTGSGWLIRGDCAKEVRATEATATAKAETKAETVLGKVKLADVQIKIDFGDIAAQIAALPQDPPVPAGCPARGLTPDELRLWNASNQGGHKRVPEAGAHGPGPGDVPPAEVGGDEGPAG